MPIASLVDSIDLLFSVVAFWVGFEMLQPIICETAPLSSVVVPDLLN